MDVGYAAAIRAGITALDICKPRSSASVEASSRHAVASKGVRFNRVLSVAHHVKRVHDHSSGSQIESGADIGSRSLMIRRGA